MKYYSIFFLAFLTCFYGCSTEEEPSDVVLPNGLTVEISESDEVEGEVSVSASANNTNYYTFQFVQDGETEEYEDNNGQATHRFTESGLHRIITRAHITPTQYVEQEDTLRITLSSDGQRGIPTTGDSSPMSYPGYTLVWNDEFNGSELNSSDWNFELGTGNSGWGNNELQYYRKENTTVSDGYLTITAKKQSFAGQQYTSSRITTEGKESFQYGRIDIRAALPKGQGMWPALWMLGDRFSSIGWPHCGEIDIMEIVGGTENGNSDSETHGTLHWQGPDGYATFGGSTTISGGTFNDKFHVFSIEWDERSIKWLLDDRQFHEIDIRPDHMTEFHEPFFFIFNVAVGGNWPGSPDETTRFPQSMHVDYVRVFQKS
jgi:beta-glucanase (GH16 family)